MMKVDMHREAAWWYVAAAVPVGAPNDVRRELQPTNATTSATAAA
jgi:hypothetical protein